MTTKEKIVHSAVKLFNTKGITEVAIRDIARDVGISSGNFAYHFKNKEAVLEHFYSTMYDEVTINTTLKENDGFAAFQQILKDISNFMNKYRFFYRDVIEIFRLCPDIKKNYASKYVSRKEIYKGILQHFIARSLLKADAKDRTLNDITHTIWFTMTFWQAQKKILPEGSHEVQADFVITQIWHLLVPLMTKKGLAAYEEIK
jgi:AcrR family transcriptional regulator